jgi:DNA-binding IclR family transcriptional regulator
VAEIKVQSLDRTFNILESLAMEPNGLALAEIADRLELAKSTSFRLLAVLLQRDYVRKSPETGKYRLGPGFIELSSHYLNSLELKTESAPYIKELSDRTGFVVFLAIRQGNKMVYFEKYEQFNSIRKYEIIGQQKPLYCTSLGKALLIGLEDEAIRVLLAREPFHAYGPHTITDIDTLIEDIRLSRKRGWAWDNQEAEPGINCVAAPIRDYRSQVIASISTSWRLDDRSEPNPETIAQLVIKEADLISFSMGFPKYKQE